MLDEDSKFAHVGYSMGGGIAPLMALNFHQEIGAKNVCVATFGGARVFNSNAARIYNKALGGQTVRVTNPKDVVPKLPPSFMDYAHVGEKLVVSPKYSKNELKNRIDVPHCPKPALPHTLFYYRKGIQESDFIKSKQNSTSLTNVVTEKLQSTYKITK